MEIRVPGIFQKFGSVFCLASVTTCFMLTGCGRSSNLPETAQVSGTVTLDGKPLTHGTVVFMPKDGRGAHGKIQSDGSFVLSTTKDSYDGATIGEHRISVFCNEERASDTSDGKSTSNQIEARMRPVPTPSLIPKTYNDPSTSGLREEVKSEVKNHFELRLFSRGH